MRINKTIKYEKQDMVYTYINEYTCVCSNKF